jgi:hypothetical protein
MRLLLTEEFKTADTDDEKMQQCQLNRLNITSEALPQAAEALRLMKETNRRTERSKNKHVKQRNVIRVLNSSWQ